MTYRTKIQATSRTPSPWLSLFAPFKRRTTTQQRLLAELEQVALRAPHLLADIGFSYDARASSPGKAVWTKDRLSIAVSNAQEVVSISEA